MRRSCSCTTRGPRWAPPLTIAKVLPPMGLPLLRATREPVASLPVQLEDFDGGDGAAGGEVADQQDVAVGVRADEGVAAVLA